MIESLVQLVQAVSVLYSERDGRAITRSRDLTPQEKKLIQAINADHAITSAAAAKLLLGRTGKVDKRFSTRISRLKTKVLNLIAITSPSKTVSDRLVQAHAQTFAVHIGDTLFRTGAHDMARTHLRSAIRSNSYLDLLPTELSAKTLLMVDASSQGTLRETIQYAQALIVDATDLLHITRIKSMTAIIRASSRKTQLHKITQKNAALEAVTFLNALEADGYTPRVGIAAARLATGVGQILHIEQFAIHWLEILKTSALSIDAWNSINRRDYHIQRLFIFKYFARYTKAIAEIESLVILTTPGSVTWFGHMISWVLILLNTNRTRAALEIVEQAMSHQNYTRQSDFRRHRLAIARLYTRLLLGEHLSPKMWKDVTKSDIGIAHQIAVLQLLHARKTSVTEFIDHADKFVRTITRSREYSRSRGLMLLARLVSLYIREDMKIAACRLRTQFVKMETELKKLLAIPDEGAIVPWHIVWVHIIGRGAKKRK